MPTGESDLQLFDPVALGEQVAERRRAKGIPQDKLALAVGISRVQLQNLERGLSDRAKGTPANPRLTTLVGLCRELGGTLRIDLARPSRVEIIFESDPAEE